jgi:hypothetical protein
MVLAVSTPGLPKRHNSALKDDFVKHAPSDEKKKALAAALRENLKRRKAQLRGRKAEADPETDTTSASQAGASANDLPAHSDLPRR